MNVLAQLRIRFQNALAALAGDPAAYAAMVKPAQDTRFGDYQANCAMPLAKERKVNPRDLAQEIVARLDVADLCEPPEVAGPGFINLRLRDAWLEAAANDIAGDDRLGVPSAQSPRTYVVDYSAPNVAKPMHVGHLRSTVIGAALYRLAAFLGHRAISDNHIGDWGTQFGMIIFGYKHFLDAAAFQKDAVGELARLYRLVNQLSEYHEAAGEIERQTSLAAEKRAYLAARETPANESGAMKDKAAQKDLGKLRNELAELERGIAALRARRAAVEQHESLRTLAAAHPNIAQDARAETAKLHAGDEENRRLWEHFVPMCLEALQGVYRRLGVTFDYALGESFYQPMLEVVVEDLAKRGLARESQGAMCVFIQGNEAPFIIRKADGAFNYATTDLATIKYRAEKFDADAILYVVDARQSEHFRLLFETARRWGYSTIDFEHVSFGTVLGEDRRPFKTRSGDTVGLESLLDEAVARAREIVDANDDAKESPELDEAARADVAEAVGIGGIKYADLRHNRESDYVFSWEKMLAKTGDTATYIQYSYARISGIFRKGNVQPAVLRERGARVRFTHPAERALGLQLLRFAETLEAAAAECRPNILTQYLFETANSFSTFYENCPVLPERDEETRSSRLLLCLLTARVLAQGLELLGIRTCEQM
jgi:arginyl-tRNA synthetase